MTKRRADVTVTSTVAVDSATAFAIFTEDIDLWWRRSPRYRFLRSRDGVLRFEPGVGGQERADEFARIERGDQRLEDLSRSAAERRGRLEPDGLGRGVVVVFQQPERDPGCFGRLYGTGDHGAHAPVLSWGS